MCILYKYIYITSITFWAIFELVSANIARQILWTYKILSCPAIYTIQLLINYEHTILILNTNDLNHAYIGYMRVRHV